MKLSDSCEMYVSCFGRDKAFKIRLQSRETENKLEKSETYRHILPFPSLNSGGKFKLYIMYNSDVSTDRAVTLAYELGSTDIVQHVALYLRNMIAEAF